MRDFDDTTITIIAGVVAASLWLLWALFSDTRHNHGFWVAFLMPLTPVIIPVIWVLFSLIKYTTLLIFIALKRREDHDEFMRKLKIKSGVFILFK